MQKSFMTAVAVLIVVIGYYIFYPRSERKEVASQKEHTTVAQCVNLSKDIRMNENTKDCFDNLSNEEFFSLIDPENKDANDLYEEISSYYDTRTDAQKQADAEANSEFFGKIIESNQKASK